MEKAVIDRIVDDKHAVILVGNEQIEKLISVDKLPDGVSEGTWAKIEYSGNDIVTILVDQEETNKTKERIKSKMDLLRKRSKSGE